MENKTIVKMLGLTILGIFLLSFTTTLAAENVKIEISKGPNKKMILEKSIKNGKIENVEVDGHDVTGSVDGLYIREGTTERRIIWIQDDTLMESEGSQCTWYFYRGQWWRICY